MKHFQSYLFVGEKDDTENETLYLAANLQIDTSPQSPDFSTIKPEGQSITIDQIRNLNKYVFQKPFKSKFRLAVLKNSEKLTLPAQNALLKILEESPRHAIIILEATEKESLLPTIRSRVVTKNIVPKAGQKQKIFLSHQNRSLENILDNLAMIDDPILWLNGQIVAMHYKLIHNIGENRPISCAKIAKSIENCVTAKKMIQANVNPKFALFNLALHLNSTP